MSKVWFVTGANSGFGTSIAKAALDAGDQVVATARNMGKLRAAFPDFHGELALDSARRRAWARPRLPSREAVAAVRPHRCPRQQRGEQLPRQFRGADQRRVSKGR